MNEITFEEFLYDISREDIHNLALVNPEINNVVAGIVRDITFTTLDADEYTVRFMYINCRSALKGYYLKLRFQQEKFYEHILMYSIAISREFETVDPIKTNNDFLFQLRTGLEKLNVTTISIKEIKRLKKIHENEQVALMSPFGIEVIPFIDKHEFFSTLLGSEDMPAINKESNYVYVLTNARNGLYKIGRSKNPLKREKTLQAEEPEIILLKYWEADKTFEKQLHNEFKSKRVRGEWFKLTIGDIFRIKEMIPQSHFDKQHTTKTNL